MLDEHNMEAKELEIKYEEPIAGQIPVANSLQLNEWHGFQKLCDVSSEVKAGKQALPGAIWLKHMPHMERINQLLQPDQ